MYRILFPTPLEEVDVHNDNIDVCIQTDNGQTYTFVVATPANLIKIMKEDGLPYIKPGTPFIIVNRITENVIRQAIESFLEEDERILNVYGKDIV